MKKKFKLLAMLGCLMGLCVGLAACDDLTVPESYEKKGYTVTVTYDAGVGTFGSSKATMMTDMYNPSKFKQDEDGTVHIQLTDPSSALRTPDVAEDSKESGYTPTLAACFLAGWYQERSVRIINGQPVDDNGNVLFERDNGTFIRIMSDANGLPIETIRTKTDEDTGTLYDSEGYVLVETEDGKFYRVGRKDENGKVLEGYFDSSGLPMVVTPAYDYADPWDFSSDTLDYNKEEDGKKKSITLYAGWIQYFEFRYFYRFEDQSNGEWTAFGNYTFDYKTVQNGKDKNNNKYDDQDTVWLPKWSNGAMEYETPYKSSGKYSFPKIEGSTFKAAYKDAECTEQIVGFWEHEGEIDYETCKANDPIQNVYIVVERGEHYKISTAKQLYDYANVKGFYEILNDIDFSYVENGETKQQAWSTVFSNNDFEGRIYGSEGQTFKISNIHAESQYESNGGGIFGSIAEGAKIENIIFENVQFDISSVNFKPQGAKFGLLAGEIAENTISNVEVYGTLLIGAIRFNTMDYEMNLLANGVISGFKNYEIVLTIYGKADKDDPEKYNYTIDPEETDAVKVDENGGITLTFVKGSEIKKDQASYNIKINGGN